MLNKDVSRNINYIYKYIVLISDITPFINTNYEYCLKLHYTSKKSTSAVNIGNDKNLASNITNIIKELIR